MRTDNDRVLATAWDRGNNAELTPRVREFLNTGAVVPSTRVVDGLLDLVVQPVGRLDAVLRLVVAGVEGRESSEMLTHVFFRQLVR